jgi:malonate transporter
MAIMGSPLPVAMTVIIYNLLSVYTLTRSLQQADKNTFARTWRGIVRNPLIIAIAAGFLVNAARVPLPEVLLDSAGYLGQMVLPLALICIGGALNMKQLRHVDRTALLATSWKLVASPIIACSLGLTLGLAEENLVILFLLAASPTATVSFVMVQAMSGHAKLAANIILHTTLISLVTITAGLWLLHATGWA